MKKQYGLIGFPLSHSFSKKYFTEKFLNENISHSEYLNFEIENIQDLKVIIENHPDLTGLNITIPHKENVIPFLHEMDEISKKIGAVNTIKIERQNQNIVLKGFNTDVIGFEMALKPMLRSHHTRALVLGNGGASKAVQYVLKKLGIDFLLVVRQPQQINEMSYSALNENYLKFHPLIIHTTPVGMLKDEVNYPNIPYEFITSEHFLFDLIYNPEKTVFLQKGEEKGAMVSNGLTMLIQQAEAAWQIWNKK